MKRAKDVLARSGGEAPVKFLVSTDPEPDPFVTATKSYRAIIFGNSNRPGTLVRAQALQSQPRVRGMLRKQLICLLGGGANGRGQLTVQPPKLGRRA